MAIEKVIKIKVDSKDAVKGIDNIDKSINEVDESTEALQETTSSLTGSLDKMTGGLISGFKGAVSGVRKGIMAMKSLKVAIAATGIGLLVLAIGSLVTYFTQTQRGADLVSKSFAAIGATIDVLVDRVSSFGEGMALIFSGKFEEGATKLKGSFKDIGTEILAEANAAYELEDALNKLEEREIKLIKVNARRRASIDSLRLAAEDENKTNKERAEALQQAADLQNQIYNDEISIAKERARISQEQTDLGESTREEIRANEELQAKVIQLESERDRGLLRLQTRLNSFTDSQKESNKVVGETFEQWEKRNEQVRKQLEKEKEERDREAKQRQLDTKELQVWEDEQEKIITDAEDRRLEKEWKANQERKKLRDEEIIKEQQVRDAKFAIANQTLGMIGAIAKKGSKLAKGVAIAQTLMNTYQGVTAALAAPSTIPEPFGSALKFANAAAIGVTGALNVKKILSTDETGETTGSSPSVGGGGGVSTPSFNLVKGTGTNQIAEGLNKSEQPVKAFVVSGDVTTAQELDNNAIDDASL